ncbi:MAG TPA: GumC family protein, partial [Sphingomonadaceae bacterium]|nr:GumC family protein [Sphingomonadaceae bacterium]
PIAAGGERPAGALDEATMKALSILSETVSVEREGDTNVVSIDVRAPTPILAQRIAAILADTYIDLRLDARESEARRLSVWIDARADELRAQLTDAEMAVTAYRIENNLLADSGGLSLSDQQLTEINAELIRARADLAEKRASYEHYMRVRAGNGDLQSLPEVQDSPIIVALREAQLDLQRREQEASQVGRANNPRLAQIQRQLAAVDQQLDEEVLRVAEVLANETEALESRARILAAALERAGGQSGLETRSAVELRELERIVEAYRLRYERYLNNAGLANELGSFATSGTQVVSSATQPLLPVYPPTKVFVLLSFLLGVGLALAVRLVRDTLSTGFDSIEEIEH